MGISLDERMSGLKDHFYRTMLSKFASGLRVSVPGVVVSFDPTAQTVSVQPLIQEEIRNPDQTSSWVNLPILVDVPVCFPRGGGFSFTLPLKAGDEGIILFADQCLDGWFSYAGTSPTPQVQSEKRRHDLSDGMFLPGIYNQSRTLPNFSTTAAQLRNDSGTSYISLNNDGSITIKGKTSTQTW